MVSITLRVAYHPDESATSLLSRMAAANHVKSVAEFGRLMRINPTMVANGEDDELRALFSVAGFDLERATASQPNLQPGSRRAFSFGTLPSRRVARTSFRFCLHCLSADVTSGLDRPTVAPYHRLSWLLSFFRTCPVHSTPLLQIPNKFARSFDFLGSVRPYIADLSRLAASDVRRESDFECYLQRRITEGKGGATLPDSLGVHGLVTACEALGQVAELGPTVRSRDLSEDTMARTTNAGFKILKQGASGLSDFLASIEPEKEGTRKASIYRTWGRFYSVALQYRGDDLEPVKEILRKAILRRYPKKVGSIVLDQKVVTREIHTVESAAKAVGVSPKTLVNLGKNDPAIRTLCANFGQAGTITDEVLEHLRAGASRMVRVEEVLAQLGMTNNQFQAFRKCGLIKMMPGLGAYYDKLTVDGLIKNLSAHAVPSANAPANAWNFLDAISSGLSAGKAVEMVSEKRLNHVWLIESEVGLRRIWLDREESKLKLHPNSRA